MAIALATLGGTVIDAALEWAVGESLSEVRAALQKTRDDKAAKKAFDAALQRVPELLKNEHAHLPAEFAEPDFLAGPACSEIAKLLAIQEPDITAIIDWFLREESPVALPRSEVEAFAGKWVEAVRRALFPHPVLGDLILKGYVLKLVQRQDAAGPARSKLDKSERKRPAPPLLPNPPEDFVGRAEPAAVILEHLVKQGGSAITAIGGMGGIGKSALALHVAHQLAEAAPDGRIFVDMGGTSDQPLSPAGAMAKVIQALEPEVQAPTELEPAQHAYRSVLDGRRVLLLLDNAETSAQVKPLIDWRAPTTMVLATSRHALTAPGLKSLQLDVMDAEEAKALLRAALGERTISDEDLAALAERCGRLPLALRVAGTFLAESPEWSIERYLNALADEKKRPEIMKFGEGLVRDAGPERREAEQRKA